MVQKCKLALVGASSVSCTRSRRHCRTGKLHDSQNETASTETSKGYPPMRTIASVLVDASSGATRPANQLVLGRNDTSLKMQYDMSKPVTCGFPCFSPAEWIAGIVASVDYGAVLPAERCRGLSSSFK
ncbi:hypothetical protein BU23DRAFT_42691 [Bimuria novae-zelandiae CBS 107.79]|uniref:Uncharacterized protein n=1 Tax=Bimuria novae-zelandiae CBS 107.79 TaxID=1447943 RepID=A0A6A5VSG5_9PLEO|nr:hypothetical protein BU23DRAFT_42691 [Bimuria novae-zelandiae CBS 107.79]